MNANFLRGVIAAATLLAGPAAFAATNLISDGDFSTPDQAGTWNVYSPGINGWVSANDGIEIGNSPNNYGLPCANAGCQNLEVNANTFGDDYQDISGLTPGAWYNLAYLYGGRTSGGPDFLDVYFGGQLLTTNGDSIGSWTPNSFLVQATSSTERLEFVSQDTSGMGGLPSYGNEITNVSLMMVPEASTWTMMIAGFVGLGVIGARARRRLATV
ncbi:MAG TPA: PEP-CTERM sorting domain-containing protein [Roseiarcus sp.]|nr:PEP-CTERM sorting domain-containing protein [Roseiarcus sp.]